MANLSSFKQETTKCNKKEKKTKKTIWWNNSNAYLFENWLEHISPRWNEEVLETPMSSNRLLQDFCLSLLLTLLVLRKADDLDDILGLFLFPSNSMRSLESSLHMIFNSSLCASQLPWFTWWGRWQNFRHQSWLEKLKISDHSDYYFFTFASSNLQKWKPKDSEG